MRGHMFEADGWAKPGRKPARVNANFTSRQRGALRSKGPAGLRGSAGRSLFFGECDPQFTLKVREVVTGGGLFGEQKRKLPGQVGNALGTREAKDWHQVRQRCLGVLPSNIRQR